MKRKKRNIFITQNDFNSLSFIDPSVEYLILGSEGNNTIISKHYTKIGKGGAVINPTSSSSVVGTVVKSETPVNGAICTLFANGSTYTTLTDENGAFELNDVPVGDFFTLVVESITDNNVNNSVSIVAGENDLGNIELIPYTRQMNVIGSSLSLGRNATSDQGWAYDLFNGGDYNNYGVSGSDTTDWIANLATINAYDGDNLIIGLSLGNESEDLNGFNAGMQTLVEGITHPNIFVNTNYAKAIGGSPDDLRYESNKWLEENLGTVCFNHMGGMAELNNSIINSLDSGDGTHPNDAGHEMMANAINTFIIDNINSFDWGAVPNSITNTNKCIYKADANTANPITIQTTDVNKSWTIEFDMKCDDTTQSKNLFSTYQDGVSYRMYLDTDNYVKLTDGTNTINTGIDANEIVSWHRYTLRFNQYLSLMLYIDGAYVNAINYIGSEITNTTPTTIVLGGLYNDNTNDCIDFYCRNVVVHRVANDPPRITESGTNQYIVKASQEFYNDFSNTKDLGNKSQVPTYATINDDNVVNVTESTGGIMGIAVENGTPVQGAIIEVIGTGITGTSNADGTFKIDNVTPSTYSVTVTYNAQTEQKDNVVVNIGSVTDLGTVDVTGAFNPLDLNPYIFLDAKNTVEEGGKVTTWTDLSDNENNAIQATVSRQGSLNANGDAVIFNNYEHYDYSPQIDLVGKEIIVVSKTSVTNTAQVIVANSDGAINRQLRFGDENGIDFGFATPYIYGREILEVGKPLGTDFVQVGLVCDTYADVYINGVKELTTTEQNTHALEIGRLGIRGNLTEGLQGEIAYVMIFDILTTEQRTNLYTWLDANMPQ
jgi:hypothetical protein